MRSFCGELYRFADGAFLSGESTEEEYKAKSEYRI